MPTTRQTPRDFSALARFEIETHLFQIFLNARSLTLLLEAFESVV
jgi:hypothetical protein